MCMIDRGIDGVGMKSSDFGGIKQNFTTNRCAVWDAVRRFYTIST